MRMELLVLLLGVSGPSLMAGPKIGNIASYCEYLPIENGNWEERGGINIVSENAGIRFTYVDGGPDGLSGMGSMFTTQEEGEHRVEGACYVGLTLSDSKAFKITEFEYDVPDAQIGSPQGFIELQAEGNASLVGVPNSEDEFNKTWNVKKAQLESFIKETDASKKVKMNPFIGKKEQKTVCGKQIKLKINTRAVAHSNQASDPDDRLTTGFSVNNLRIKIEACVN